MAKISSVPYSDCVGGMEEYESKELKVLRSIERLLLVINENIITLVGQNVDRVNRDDESRRIVFVSDPVGNSETSYLK